MISGSMSVFRHRVPSSTFEYEHHSVPYIRLYHMTHMIWYKSLYNIRPSNIIYDPLLYFRLYNNKYVTHIWKMFHMIWYDMDNKDNKDNPHLSLLSRLVWCMTIHSSQKYFPPYLSFQQHKQLKLSPNKNAPFFFIFEVFKNPICILMSDMKQLNFNWNNNI